MHVPCGALVLDLPLQALAGSRERTAPGGGVVNGQAPLGDQGLDVTSAQPKSQVPPDASQDDHRLELPLSE